MVAKTKIALTILAAAFSMYAEASRSDVGNMKDVRLYHDQLHRAHVPTSTHQTYTYDFHGQKGTGSKNEGDSSFGFVGLSFSILPFLPPDQNISLFLTNSELSIGEWDVPPEQELYPVRSTIGNSLMGFRVVGDGTASPNTLRVNGTVTYQWISNDTQTHMLSFFFNSYASEANVNTEWYVPGYEANTLGVGIGQDLAYSIIYAAGDAPPVPHADRTKN